MDLSFVLSKRPSIKPNRVNELKDTVISRLEQNNSELSDMIEIVSNEL